MCQFNCLFFSHFLWIQTKVLFPFIPTGILKISCLNVFLCLGLIAPTLPILLPCGFYSFWSYNANCGIYFGFLLYEQNIHLYKRIWHCWLRPNMWSTIVLRSLLRTCFLILTTIMNLYNWCFPYYLALPLNLVPISFRPWITYYVSSPCLQTFIFTIIPQHI